MPENLPRVEVIHDLDEDEKVCACGADLSRIGEEVSEKLDIVPAKIQVIRHIRYKYACKNCEGVEDEGPTVKTAPPPAQIIPKGLATAGLVAHIAVAKYADALPLYRQEKIFARHGIELTRSTMAGWMVKAADCCEPLMRLLRRELIAGPLVNVDETPVQVLDEPGGPTPQNPPCGYSGEGLLGEKPSSTGIRRRAREMSPRRCCRAMGDICNRMLFPHMTAWRDTFAWWVALHMCGETL